MKKQTLWMLLFTMLVIGAGGHVAQGTPLLSEDFEGLALGPLDGQGDWVASDVTVQDAIFQSGDQAAEIEGADGFMQQSFTSGDTNVWTDLWIQPVLSDDAPEIDEDATVLMYFNQDGHPVVYDGQDPIVTNVVTVTTGEWVRLTVRSDYETKTWDLYVNGASVAEGLGFYNDEKEAFTELTIRGAGSHSAFVDDILVQLESTLADLYLVTLDMQGGSNGTESVTATFGEPMPSATAPERDGYTFLGYFAEEEGSGTQYYNDDMSSANDWDVAADATIYADWEANEYTVTLDMQGGSNGTASVTATFDAPMPPATAPEREGYTFLGYFAEEEGSGTQYYNDDMSSANDWDVADDATIYADWEEVDSLVSQLGILDLAANDGINPTTEAPWEHGDSYRLLFLTSEMVDPKTSEADDIAYWNNAVQDIANNSTAYDLSNAIWRVAGSTADVDARDNTWTNPEVDGDGHAVFGMNGSSVIVTNFVQLWAGEALENLAWYDENGVALDDSDAVAWPLTGTSWDGTRHSSLFFRDISGGGEIRQGRPNYDDGRAWIDASRSGATWSSDSTLSVYGMSERLFVVDLDDEVPPAFDSFANDVEDGPIELPEATVVYTVTFDEAILPSTVTTDDFENALDADISIDSVRQLEDPAVFEVTVTATSDGSLQLQIMEEAVITDLNGNALDTSAAITDDTVITVESEPTLTIDTFNPTNNAVDVAVDASLIAEFSHEITIDTGNIVITNLTDASAITIDVTDGSQVSVSNDTNLVISPADPLAYDTQYAVLIDDGAIVGFEGIDDTNTWSFTTEPIPTTTKTWTGEQNSEWTNADNWEPEVVPDIEDNVSILSGTPNDPVIGPTDVVEISNLTVAEGATLTIESGSSGTGALIVNGTQDGEGTVIAERYMEDKRWYILGSPVSGQAMKQFVLDGDNNVASSDANGTTNYMVRFYNEPSNSWTGGNGEGDYLTSTYLNDGDPEFESGHGFALQRNGSGSSGRVSFHGSLETDIVEVEATRENERFGWNALANPYTAPIGITEGSGAATNFLSLNASKFRPEYQALYVWNGVESRYDVINQASDNNPFNWDSAEHTKYIQSGQGFLVNATNEVGTFTFSFTPDMRHAFADSGGQPGIMSVEGTSSGTAWSGVRLGVRVNGGSEHVTDVLFNEEMSMGLDAGYDAGAAPGQSVYTHQAQGDSEIGLGIQALPLTAMDNLSIPVGLASGSNGEVTFRLETSGLPDYVSVRLEDTLDFGEETGLMVQSDSSEATMTFTVDQGEDTDGRFYVVFDVETTESGISKLWLDTRGLDIDGSADNTRVGDSPFTVYEEYIAGTDPNNIDDILRMTGSPERTKDGNMVRWQAVPNRRYTIQRSTNLLTQPPFVTLAEGVDGAEGVAEFLDDTADGPGPYYYRIVVEREE